MAFQAFAGFTSAVATDPAATAAGYLTPTRYNLPHVYTGVVSGGIPYGTSTTTQDYSALLASGGVVIGGGTGNPPKTDAGFTSSGTGATFGIGVTGVSQSTIGGLGFAGAESLYLFSTNANAAARTYTTSRIALDANLDGVYLASSMMVSWAGAANLNAFTKDTGLSRISAGVIGAGTGAQGSVAGTFRGLYQSSDGTAGETFSAAILTLTVKNGLIVGHT